MLRRGLLVVSSTLALSATALAGVGGWDGSPPNDPNYAAAERSCATTSVNDEQYYLYSFISTCTPQATDPRAPAACRSIARRASSASGGRPFAVRTVRATASAGARVTIGLPAATRRVVVHARDDAGNVGAPVTAR
jgi:hypothetical protein